MRFGQTSKVILNFGGGSCEGGFPVITAQIWHGDIPDPFQVVGALPEAAQLAQDFRQWQTLYRLLPGNLPSCRTYRSTEDFELEEDDITNVSSSEFRQLSDRLEKQFNAWLDAEGFRPIDRRLRTLMTPGSPVQIMLVAQDKLLLRLPWCRWTLLDDYPGAEVALSPLSYGRSLKTAPPTGQGVKVLGILGSAKGIDVETDRRILEALPDVQAQFLLQPSWEKLSQHLWSEPWDILFFAGHSTSETQGYIQLSETESITVAQLKHALTRAIQTGLQLAILNSCDGLGFAWELADLNIPQVIAMGEPVADPVAQAFLKSFLTAFSSHQTLYQSVREARAQLQSLEAVHYCASWLPVIVQNPAERPPTWQSLGQATTPAPLATAPLPTAATAPASSPAALRGISPAHTSPVHTGPAHTSTTQTPKSPAPSPPSASPPSLSPASASFSAQQSAPIKPSRPQRIRQRIALWSTLGATIAVLGLGGLGYLMPLELWSFDQLMRLRPAEEADSRFLVVTIDEADIQAQALTEREVSLSDPSLAQLLGFLRQAEARIVGIDLYRDFPVSQAALSLIDELQMPNVIGICKGRDAIVDKTGIGPPPEMAPRQIGFSDFVTDTDGVLRRQILSMEPDITASCRPDYSFASQIAFNYLAQQEIFASYNDNNQLQLGDQVFKLLGSNSGGYQSIDAQGSQMMLNYRALKDPEAIAPTVSLSDVLARKLSPEAVRDRIVLIGVIAPSNGDFWATPYGSGPFQEVSGVFIHAHVISQILSAVLDQRPLIWTWPQRVEQLWILVCAALGSFGMMQVGHSLKALILWSAGFILLLTGLCWLLLLGGGWIPLIPAAMAFTLAATATLAFLQPGSFPGEPAVLQSSRRSNSISSLNFNAATHRPGPHR